MVFARAGDVKASEISCLFMIALAGFKVLSVLEVRGCCFIAGWSAKGVECFILFAGFLVGLKGFGVLTVVEAF